MNKEEIDKWLDNEYGCSYTRLEELHDFLIDRNMKYQDELERYKNIVHELETYLQRKYCEYVDMESDDAFVISLVLDTLRELKGE